jgi:death-on-curing protein
MPWWMANERLALGGLIAFYGLNGRRLTLSNDAAYDLIMAVATGVLDTVADTAGALAGATPCPDRDCRQSRASG